MRVANVSLGVPVFHGTKSKKTSNVDSIKSVTTVNGGKFVLHDENNLFNIKDISDKKVGDKIILIPTISKFSDLNILITPDTKLYSQDGKLQLQYSAKAPSLNFSGQVYGSIRKDENGTDENMKRAYKEFWQNKMYAKVPYSKKSEKIKNDYNFFIPTDGDGTRFRDITQIQGGITKPASKIPATLNGHQMKLVHGVLMNFHKTGIPLGKKPEFVTVKPAQGSAYAFLEGLASGQISTDKPLVFSWGDNFSDINISKLIVEHEKNNSALTMLTLPVDREGIQSIGAVKVKSKEDLEILDFYEKPKTDELLDEYVIPNTEDEYLGVVGPYILSKEALKWLKEEYTTNKEKFLDFEGKADFSRKVVGQLLELSLKDGLKDDEGNSLKIRAYRKPQKETWSDLGSQKDFCESMQQVKTGSYSHFPREMKKSIASNIDKNNNITMDSETKTKLDKFLSKYDLYLQNAVVNSLSLSFRRGDSAEEKD